jgi:superfamily II DNA or RNA helicase
MGNKTIQGNVMAKDLILRDYQELSITKLAMSIKQGLHRPVLMMPTGSGKTSVAAMLAKRAVKKGNRVWFTVDNLELVDQTVSAFQLVGLDVSVIQGIHELTDYRKSVQVITNQTLIRRWRVFDQHPEWLPDLIIHDECHVMYKAHHQIHMMMPDKPVIGLSATPFANNMGKLYNNMVVGHTTQELIDEGYLCDFDAFAPFTPDMAGVKTKNGDFDPGESVNKVNQKEIVGNVVTEWKKHAAGRKTIVFACNIAHSEQICMEYRSAGINAVHLDGYTDKEERKEIVGRFREGQIDVLCSVMVLTKGFDAPIASCAVLAAPTKSLMKYIQQVGRVLRPHDSHDKALILDHAGNIERLGFPTDELPQYLDNGDKAERKARKKEEKKEKLPVPCPACKYLTATFPCPSCGFVPQKVSTVEEKEGELRKIEKADMETKRKWLSMFLGYAREKGYSDGWAAHKYREKFGVWPAKKSNAHPIKPDKEVKGYITYLNIKFAKSQRFG